ncbi:MAG: hypothetical protein K8T91_07955 [Planctomycetes bacterium]|nr:hypothetical protein [Planctomycetota bacterium]
MITSVLAAWPALVTAQSPRDTVRLAELDRQQRLWANLAESDPSEEVGCREIMGHALALAEARQNPEWLGRLFELLARMQDRDRQSKTFGNLRWRWGDTEVNDLNAVEFCLHDALLLWKRHRDWIPAEVRPQVSMFIRYAMEGVRRHRVAATYTNIALTRTANLIIVGEVLRRRDVAEEGEQRLDELVSWTAAHGIRECVSPTYYGVDINALMLIATLSESDRVRRQADALLKLFWTDIALNWFPPSERLGGANSRTYDYLAGRGALDWHLWSNDWFHSPTPGKSHRVEPYWHEWTPPAELHAMSLQRVPRLVRQSWGDRLGQSRTYMLYRDIALSTLSAGYGPEDVPLAIDILGPRGTPRAFFRADDRQNPYGMKKHASGPGGQMKATHPTPFWIGAQRSSDALVMAIYDSKADSLEELQSHLVLPRKAQSITIGGDPVDMSLDGNKKRSVLPGQAIVLRYGTAAVGLRVLTAATRQGRTASLALIDDDNSYNCIRLTAEHGAGEPLREIKTGAADANIALWVRVGTNLADEASFQAWRKMFEDSQPTRIAITAEGVALEVPGLEGAVALSARFNSEGQASADRIIPEPSRSVLELDGQDVGRTLLDAAIDSQAHPSKSP